MTRRRRLDPFDKRSMALSAAMHATLFLAAWGATLYEPEEYVFLTYEVELVSPPPARQQAEEVVEERTEDLVIETPEPEPLPPAPEPEEVVPVAEPEPEPPPPEPEPTSEPEPEPAEETVMAEVPEEVEETPEVSGEDLNVRMQGLQRDYPAYYNNIILQIRRCFRWREGGRWQTTVVFRINRDGSVSDARFETRSGNTAFDFEALGAVECAGRGNFGPLPADMPYDWFPIRFQFQPSGDVRLLPAYGAPDAAQG